jgi:TfoX/Sxy family transcriptional regulator of competence genes
MNNDEVVIKSIIQDLSLIGVDGETMQHILKETGMEWQMLRQLMLTMPIDQVEYLMEERKDLMAK